MTTKNHNTENCTQSEKDAENQEGQKKMSAILANLRELEEEFEGEDDAGYDEDAVDRWGETADE